MNDSLLSSSKVEDYIKETGNYKKEKVRICDVFNKIYKEKEKR